MAPKLSFSWHKQLQNCLWVGINGAFGAVYANWKTILESFMPTERQFWSSLCQLEDNSGAVYVNWKTILESFMSTERQFWSRLCQLKDNSGAIYANWKTILEPLMPTERQVLEPFMPFQWHWSRDSELFLAIWRGYSDLRKKWKYVSESARSRL